MNATKWFYVLIESIAVLLHALPLFAGPHEQMAILAARVKYAIALRDGFPDEPPNLNLNLRTTTNAVPEPIDEQTEPDSGAGSEHGSSSTGDAPSSVAPVESTAPVLALTLTKSEAVGAAPNLDADHAHRCANPRCGHAWTHNPKTSGPTSHNCPRCGTYNNEIAGCYPITVLFSKSCVPCKGYENNLSTDNKQAPELDVSHADIEDSAAFAAMEREFGKIPREKDGMTIMVPVTAFRTVDGKPQFLHGAFTLPNLIAKLRAAGAETIDHHAMQSTAVSGMGGALKGRKLIIDGANQFRTFIGDGKRLRFQLDKSGAASMDLLHTNAWTVQQALGRSGRLTVSGDLPAQLPFKEIAFTYKLNDADQMTIDLDSFSFQLPDGKRGYGATAAQAYGFDPITIGWSVFNLFHAIYEIMHPQVDINLPGGLDWTVGLNGENIVVEFQKQLPAVRVQAWMQFWLPLQRVAINPQQVKVEFDQQSQRRNWIKIHERTIQVTD